MNAGELKEKIEILTLENTGAAYEWAVTAQVWAKAEKTEQCKRFFTKTERLDRANTFLNIEVGGRFMEFTMRSRELGLDNAIRWQGQHCFLTNLVELDQRYCVVSVVLVEPKVCVVRHMDGTTLNALNRPVLRESSTLTFPGCLLEKCLRNRQMESTKKTEKDLWSKQIEPMTRLEAHYMLVTPKAITLQVGDLVTIEGTTYAVLLLHTLDEHKNKYEIVARRNP